MTLVDDRMRLLKLLESLLPFLGWYGVVLAEIFQQIDQALLAILLGLGVVISRGHLLAEGKSVVFHFFLLHFVELLLHLVVLKVGWNREQMGGVVQHEGEHLTPHPTYR